MRSTIILVFICLMAIFGASNAANCSLGCASCVNSTLCTRCNDEWYLSTTFCYQCSRSCKNCHSFLECDSCRDGYYLSGTSCVHNAEPPRFPIVVVFVLMGLCMITIVIVIAKKSCKEVVIPNGPYDAGTYRQVTNPPNNHSQGYQPTYQPHPAAPGYGMPQNGYQVPAQHGYKQGIPTH